MDIIHYMSCILGRTVTLQDRVVDFWFPYLEGRRLQKIHQTAGVFKVQCMYYCILNSVRQIFSWLRKSYIRYHCILCFVINLNVGFCLSEVKVAVFCIANGFFILLGIERWLWNYMWQCSTEHVLQCSALFWRWSYDQIFSSSLV